MLIVTVFFAVKF